MAASTCDSASGLFAYLADAALAGYGEELLERLRDSRPAGQVLPGPFVSLALPWPLCVTPGAAGWDEVCSESGSMDAHVRDYQAMRATCATVGAPLVVPSASDYVGVDPVVMGSGFDGQVHGLRYAEQSPGSGWYFSSDDYVGKLVKVHVGHLHSTLPHLMRFLALPPGFFFDVRSGTCAFDQTLLDES